MAGSCITPRNTSSIPSWRPDALAWARVRAPTGVRHHDLLPLPLGYGVGQPRLPHLRAAHDAVSVSRDAAVRHDWRTVDRRARHVALAPIALDRCDFRRNHPQHAHP